jgi:hypothetical protein
MRNGVEGRGKGGGSRVRIGPEAFVPSEGRNRFPTPLSPPVPDSVVPAGSRPHCPPSPGSCRSGRRPTFAALDAGSHGAVLRPAGAHRAGRREGGSVLQPRLEPAPDRPGAGARHATELKGARRASARAPGWGSRRGTIAGASSDGVGHPAQATEPRRGLLLQA